ncbi:hypothetical protein RNF46_003209 [Citrobacter freundii]|uniref:hypothetical protein n=1 Tax=Citrobacter sp. Cpo073 TaxID=2985134 RepID=UPI001B83306B|nr:hypothetical protein [Citrobacter sp. Cpo073]ELF4153234.1 hypothetical protein [Citrobacter freundii]MDM2863124.1 hypothetical protein [Citrobacter sp. Cpo073]
MTALNKQALRVPERKRHDWSQAVMRDCDFCSQWALTVKHDDGGCICASCCDAEYTSELKGALEVAIDRAEAAEKRIASLENDCWIYEGTVKKLLDRAEAAESACNETARILESGERMALTRSVEILRAAGIGMKGE